MKLLNIKYLSYFLFFIGLYFGGRYAINSIALFILIAIISLVKDGVRPVKDFPKVLLLPIGFYLIHAISVIYSTDYEASVFDLQVKFSFLILPIIFGLQKKEKLPELFVVLKLFTIATLIATISLLGISYYESFEIGRWNHYMEFSKFLHPSYLSMYLVFFLIVAIFQIANKKAQCFLLTPTILLSLTTLYFADSKAGLLILMISIGFAALKLLYKRHKQIAISISLIAVIGIFILLNYSNRFQSLNISKVKIDNILDHPEKVVESTALRILVWSASIDIIEQNPIIGVGNGDVKNELERVYTERNYKEPLLIKMNSHNQYLETAVGLGIIGLLVLLLLLIAPLIIIKKHSLLVQGYLLIISLDILVESMFNTQAGVLFIVFFYSCIISQSKKSILPS